MQAEAVFPIVHSLPHEEKIKLFKMLEGIVGAEKKPKGPKKMTATEIYIMEFENFMNSIPKRKPVCRRV